MEGVGLSVWLRGPGLGLGLGLLFGFWRDELGAYDGLLSKKREEGGRVVCVGKERLDGRRGGNGITGLGEGQRGRMTLFRETLLLLLANGIRVCVENSATSPLAASVLLLSSESLASSWDMAGTE
jgi:hypothetical protein